MKKRYQVLILFSLLFYAVPVYAAVITLPAPNLGLVGYWSLNDTSGSVARDSSGSGSNGTLAGNPSWVDGKKNGALDFDGNGDYVNVGDQTVLEPTSVTLAFWARVDNPSASLNGGVGKGYIFGDGREFSYSIDFHSGNANAHMSFDDEVSSYPTASAAIGDSNYHHWAMTAGDNTLSIYKDGVLMATTVYTGSIDYTKTDNNFSIGARSSGSYSLDGRIDDVRVYNRILSIGEIRLIYREGVTFRQSSNLGLVAYYPLNEGTSTQAGDFSGNRYNGTLTNMDATTDWVNGKKSRALDFDGTNDYVDAGDIPITGAFTISAWVYFKSFGASAYAGHIVSKWADDCCGQRSFAFYAGSGQVLTCHADDDGAAGGDPAATASISGGRWLHVVCVFDTSNDLISVFVNGVQSGSTADTLNSVYDGTNSVRIGGAEMYGGSARYCDCLIDDVRIYNRALSATEVANLYRQGQVRFGPPSNLGLVAYYPMNVATGTQASDMSGNSNNGTLTNGPVWTNGKYSKALSFDGTNDYVNLNSSVNNIEGFNTGTISGWFKSNDTGGGYIFGISDKDVVSDFMYVFVGPSTGAYSDESFNFFIERGGSQLILMFVREGHSTYLDNQWHHFAVVTGGGDNRIYIDGISKSLTFDYGSASTNEFSNINNQDSASIGTIDTSGVDTFFTGSIDDVRIYNRALSADEVYKLYLGR